LCNLAQFFFIFHYLCSDCLLEKIFFSMVTKHNLPIQKEAPVRMPYCQLQVDPQLISPTDVVKSSSSGPFGPNTYSLQANIFCLYITMTNYVLKSTFWASEKECPSHFLLKTMDILKSKSQLINCSVPSVAQSRNSNFGAVYSQHPPRFTSESCLHRIFTANTFQFCLLHSQWSHILQAEFERDPKANLRRFPFGIPIHRAVN
jgi:hypothetical protein